MLQGVLRVGQILILNPQIFLDGVADGIQAAVAVTLDLLFHAADFHGNRGVDAVIADEMKVYQRDLIIDV